MEAFIKKYIYSKASKEDIVFEKLSSINYKYIDLYYNVLLKYLKGKSLKELNQECYNSLISMYELRNSIIHYGYIKKKALERAKLDNVNFNICEKTLKNIKTTFEIIKEL